MPHKLLPSRFLIQRMPAALEAIRRHFCDFGCAPSHAEVAARIGVRRHQVPDLLRQLAALGLVGWTPGAKRSITLPRPLSMRSNSELLWELQARGLPVRLGPQGELPHAVVSAWPEAAVIDLAQLPKLEHDLLAKLDNIP